MSTTILTESPTTSTDTVAADTGPAATRRARVWTVCLASGVAAAAATTLIAVIATAAGLDIEIGGEPIPASGFAVLTLVGAVLGSAIAKLAQRTRRPRGVFVTATVVLTALSIVPDVVADAVWSTRLLLAATHLIAAAIIIPAVARRLDA